MARPEKTGLDYFPLDTSWETNMKLIKARFKLHGVGCVVELWRAIYREGYAIRWDEDTQLLFASENGIEFEDLQKIVTFAAEKGVFSKEILESQGYLTSHGIQKRWREIAVSSKRKDCSIRQELNLTTFTPEETPLTPEETRLTPEESTQSKVKERRVINPQGVNYDSSVREAEFEPTVGAHEAPPSGSFERSSQEPRSARQVQASAPVGKAPRLDAEVASAKAQLAATSAKEFIRSAVAQQKSRGAGPPADDFEPRADLDDFEPRAEGA